MDFVITAARAKAEGTTPSQLEMIAVWHDGQAVQAERGTKSRKPNPDGANRHRRIARQVRRVADEVATS